MSKPAGSAVAAHEVNLVVLPPSDMPPALASQRIAGDVWRHHACCLVLMHEHDLNNRPEWAQKVVNAIVKAQLWTREHRA